MDVLLLCQIQINDIDDVYEQTNTFNLTKRVAFCALLSVHSCVNWMFHQITSFNMTNPSAHDRVNISTHLSISGDYPAGYIRCKQFMQQLLGE